MSLITRIEGRDRSSAKSAETILSFAENVVGDRPNDYYLQAFYYATQGILAGRQGRREDQLAALKLQIRARERLVGVQNQLRLNSALAKEAELLRDTDLAIERYTELVKMTREVYGSQHPRVRSALIRLARFALRARRLSDGWDWYDEAISLQQEAGMEAEATRSRIKRLTILSTGVPEKTLAEARDILENSKTLNALDRAVVTKHLGISLFYLRKLDEAKLAFDESDALATKIPRGEWRPETNQNRLYLALVQRDHKTADQITEARLAHARKNEAPVSTMRDILDERAFVLLEQGRTAEAEALLLAAVKICTRAQTSDKLRCGLAALRLARARTENGSPRAALELMDAHESVFPSESAPAHEAEFVRARARFALGDKSALVDAIAARDGISGRSVLSPLTTRYMDEWIASTKRRLGKR